MSSGDEPLPEHREILEIRNEKGMHLQAAMLLVEIAERFKHAAQVMVSKDGRTADGGSIMGILTLEATQGSHIEIVATGPEAAELVAAIRALVEAGFNEEK